MTFKGKRTARSDSWTVSTLITKQLAKDRLQQGYVVALTENGWKKTIKHYIFNQSKPITKHYILNISGTQHMQL